MTTKTPSDITAQYHQKGARHFSLSYSHVSFNHHGLTTTYTI